MGTMKSPRWMSLVYKGLAIGYDMRSVELSTTDYANNEFVFEDIEDRWIGGGEESEVKLLSCAVFTVKQTNTKKYLR